MRLCRNLAFAEGHLLSILSAVGGACDFLTQFESLNELSMVINSNVRALSERGQAAVYGTGDLIFRAVCKRGRQYDSDTTNILSNTVFHNPNVQGAKVMTASRRNSPDEKVRGL